MAKFKSQITGHLDINIHHREDEFEGKTYSWDDVLIHGDPEGLRSLANVLLKLADLDQNTVSDLPNGAREHYHLQPKWDIACNSVETIVGRLDAKGTGAFYDSYIPRKKK